MPIFNTHAKKASISFCLPNEYCLTIEHPDDTVPAHLRTVNPGEPPERLVRAIRAGVRAFLSVYLPVNLGGNVGVNPADLVSLQGTVPAVQGRSDVDFTSNFPALSPRPRNISKR